MNCRKCGAEALDSSLFCRLCGSKVKPKSDFLWRLRMVAIAVLIVIILLLIASSHAQSKPRQVWIHCRNIPLVTGELVKMDLNTIDFKVKGILQSVNLDDVLMVAFIPPASPAAQAQIEAARRRNAELQAGTAREASQPEPRPSQPAPAPVPAPPTREVEPPSILPDRCEHHNLTIERGHYHHAGFANTLHDFHYKGEFHSSGGKVDFYITDTENFAKFMNHKKFQAFYSLEKVVDGFFDVPFQKGVDYHLVILNPSAYDGRTVSTDFCFSYPEQQ
jgi:hypothetical protein